MLLLIHIVPPEVTTFERKLFLRATMEENVATSSGSPHTPITTTTREGIIPPPPPSPVKASVIPTPMTSSSGQIPLIGSTIILFTQNATGAPFSYGMLDFDRNSVLTYSTLQTMGLGHGYLMLPYKDRL
jgi:hypothetical protein